MIQEERRRSSRIRTAFEVLNAHPPLEGIARLHDGRAIIFFKSLLDAHTAPREEIYQALADLGRPSALLLKSKLDDPQPEERRLALDALLPMATAEDLSAGGLRALAKEKFNTGDVVELQLPLGLLEIAEKSRVQSAADLIVMGSHGHGSVYNLLVGSVTEGVLKISKHPVLLVPTANKRS